MLARPAIEREVKCPFFKAFAERRNIVCEGHFDDLQALRHSFKTQVGMERHVNIYCDDNYKMCEVYRLILHCKFEVDVE